MAGKRIMVADDDPRVLDSLVTRLRQYDYEVIGFSDGRDVISRCAVFRPDLVLLDIVMPDADGYTVAGALRQEEGLADVPILFVTAQELDVPAIRKRLEEIGNCAFISKNRPFEDLLSRIKEVLG